MAQRKSEMVNAKALIYLKYDKERVSEGKELKVRKSDAESMVKKGLIEVIGEDNKDITQEDNDGAEEKEGE